MFFHQQIRDLDCTPECTTVFVLKCIKIPKYKIFIMAIRHACDY